MGSSKSSQWCYSALGLSHVHFVGEIWWTWWWAYCILFWMSTLIYHGNRTEWSPIQSVIIWVIYKIGWLCRSLICLITNMIKDRIGRHKVLLCLNINCNEICYIKTKTQDIQRFFVRKKNHSSVCVKRTVLLAVSLCNRMAERRGQQNACVSQTWHGYYLCFLLWSSLPINAFWSFTRRSV